MVKKNILFVFGGKSNEHDISILSAYNLYRFFDLKKYNMFLLFIDVNGKFILCKNKLLTDEVFLKNFDKNLSKLKLNEEIIINGDGVKIGKINIDIIFPLLHGEIGEDGAFQGFCKVINTPCVGPSVIGAAIGYDKEFTKNILKVNNLPINKFIVTYKKENIKVITNKLKKEKINFPIFTKPARSGSSIGVGKSFNIKELKENISIARTYDNKVLLEETIDGIELEIYCYIKNNKIKTTLIGDLIVDNGFYSYEKKYLGEQVINNIPSKIDKGILKQVKKLAKKSFKCMDGNGIARFDFFLDSNSNIFINEINTIPGCVGINENNTLIKESKIGYSKLIDILIHEAYMK